MADLTPFEVRRIVDQSLRRIENSCTREEWLANALTRLRFAQNEIEMATTDYERHCLTCEAVATNSRDRAYWSREILRIRGTHI